MSVLDGLIILSPFRYIAKYQILKAIFAKKQVIAAASLSIIDPTIERQHPCNQAHFFTQVV